MNQIYKFRHHIGPPLARRFFFCLRRQVPEYEPSTTAVLMLARRLQRRANIKPTARECHSSRWSEAAHALPELI